MPLTCRGFLDGRERGHLVCRFVLELPNIPLFLNAIPEDFYRNKGAKSRETLIQPWKDVLTLCAWPSDGGLHNGLLSKSSTRDFIVVFI